MIEESEAAAHLNTCFKHFLFFVIEFDLIEDQKEFLALESPVKRLREQYEEQADT